MVRDHECCRTAHKNHRITRGLRPADVRDGARGPVRRQPPDHRWRCRAAARGRRGGHGDAARLHPRKRRLRYGQITAPLHIFSRYDADAFCNKLEHSKARPLCDLTGGIHLHTVRAPDERTRDRVITGLKEKGFLLEEEN